MSLENHRFEFDDFLLDAKENVLLRDGEPLSITPKAFQLLVVLVERHGQLVLKDELLSAVWPDSFVEEGNLVFTIGQLRKVLGDSAQKPRFIETVPKRGYRFISKVKSVVNTAGTRSKFEAVPSSDAEPITSNRSVIHGSETEYPSSRSVVALAEWRQDTGADQTEQSREPSRERSLEKVAKLELVPDVAPTTRRKRERYVLALAALTAFLVVVGIGYGTYKLLDRKRSTTAPISNLEQLTSNGKTKIAAVAPDGEFVAYVIDDEGRQSLWLKNVATGSETQILPSTDGVPLTDLSFSTDGNYLYYNAKGAVYQLPILGGLPKRVLQTLGTGRLYNPISFSPDGQQFAFIRYSWEGEQSASIVVANADGTGEHVIASSRRPKVFLGSAAWSPDGRVIACIAENHADGGRSEVVTARIADGVVSSIPSPRWTFVSQIAWRPDGSGLFVIATEGRSSISHQIWSLSYPDGQARNVSNDLNNYGSIGLTSDGRSLIAVRQAQVAYIGLMSSDEPNQTKQLTRGIDRYDGIFGLSFLSNGNIIYESTPGNKGEIWIAEADSHNAKKLLDESGSAVASPDGKYLIFQGEDKEGVGLFRVNLSDGERKRLTTAADVWTSFSPDGKWVVFTRWAEQVALWKVSIDGGEAVRLTNVTGYPVAPAVSPDGKFIAFYWRKSDPKQPSEIAILPSEGGEVIKSFTLPFQYWQGYGKNAVQWEPDGGAINYVLLRDNVSNIWSQPVDGSPPHQVTNFSDQLIFNFAFSPDGKQLALSRGTFNRDVVLIRHIDQE